MDKLRSRLFQDDDLWSVDDDDDDDDEDLSRAQEAIIYERRLEQVCSTIRRGDTDPCVLLCMRSAWPRFLIAMKMREANIEVETAVDGRDLLQKWLTGRFSVVFTEMNVYEIDGIDFVETLRSIELKDGKKRPKRTTCIALLGRNSSVKRVITAGFDQFFRKPLYRYLEIWCDMLQLVSSRLNRKNANFVAIHRLLSTVEDRDPELGKETREREMNFENMAIEHHPHFQSLAGYARTQQKELSGAHGAIRDRDEFIDHLQSKVADLMTKLRAKDRKISQVEKQAKDKAHENNKLEKQLNMLSSPNAKEVGFKKKLHLLADEITVLKSENSMLQQDLKYLGMSRKRLRELEDSYQLPDIDHLVRQDTRGMKKDNGKENGNGNGSNGNKPEGKPSKHKTGMVGIPQEEYDSQSQRSKVKEEKKREIEHLQEMREIHKQLAKHRYREKVLLDRVRSMELQCMACEDDFSKRSHLYLLSDSHLGHSSAAHPLGTYNDHGVPEKLGKSHLRDEVQTMLDVMHTTFDKQYATQSTVLRSLKLALYEFTKGTGGRRPLSEVIADIEENVKTNLMNLRKVEATSLQLVYDSADALLQREWAVRKELVEYVGTLNNASDLELDKLDIRKLSDDKLNALAGLEHEVGLDSAEKDDDDGVSDNGKSSVSRRLTVEYSEDDDENNKDRNNAVGGFRFGDKGDRLKSHHQHTIKKLGMQITLLNKECGKYHKQARTAAERLYATQKICENLRQAAMGLHKSAFSLFKEIQKRHNIRSVTLEDPYSKKSETQPDPEQVLTRDKMYSDTLLDYFHMLSEEKTKKNASLFISHMKRGMMSNKSPRSGFSRRSVGSCDKDGIGGHDHLTATTTRSHSPVPHSSAHSGHSHHGHSHHHSRSNSRANIHHLSISGPSGQAAQDPEHAVNNAAVMFMAGLTKRRLTLPNQKDDDSPLAAAGSAIAPPAAPLPYPLPHHGSVQLSSSSTTGQVQSGDQLASASSSVHEGILSTTHSVVITPPPITSNSNLTSNIPPVAIVGTPLTSPQKQAHLEYDEKLIKTNSNPIIGKSNGSTTTTGNTIPHNIHTVTYNNGTATAATHQDQGGMQPSGGSFTNNISSRSSSVQAIISVASYAGQHHPYGERTPSVVSFGEAALMMDNIRSGSVSEPLPGARRGTFGSKHSIQQYLPQPPPQPSIGAGVAPPPPRHPHSSRIARGTTNKQRGLATPQRIVDTNKQSPGAAGTRSTTGQKPINPLYQLSTSPAQATTTPAAGSKRTAEPVTGKLHTLEVGLGNSRGGLHTTASSGGVKLPLLRPSV